MDDQHKLTEAFITATQRAAAAAPTALPIAAVLIIVGLTALVGCGRYERFGVTIGQAVPDVTVHRLDGSEIKLASLWADRPALIVTASLTCPIARRSCPGLTDITRQFGDRINVVILYTVEAHPKGDASPYGDGEWVTVDNYVDHVLHRQPGVLDDRLRLAKAFQERLGTPATVVVDNMDDRAWKHFGRGPNVATLVDTDGTVQAKQGWFNADGMRRLIRQWLNNRDPQ